MKKNLIALFVGAVALYGMLQAARADAAVSWTTATITGDGAVLQDGAGGLSVQAAMNFVVNTGNPTATVNGVAFQQNAITVNGSSGSQNPSFTDNGLTFQFAGVTGNNNKASNNTTYTALATSDPNLYALLGSAYTTVGGVSNSFTLTISGLQSGAAYTVVFLAQDNSAGTYSETVSSDSFPATANVGVGDTITSGLGSAFTATFTADEGGSQAFTFSGPFSGVGVLNAVEVLQAVPEPSTVALLSVAFGLIGLVAVRRFRAVPVGC